MTDTIAYRRLNPPERMILSPDLSNASPRSRQGLIGILEGATDPSFLKVLDEAIMLLKHLWRTQNPDTYLIPGSEETALETALINMLEPEDTVVVGVSGFFGERMAQMAERVGARVIQVEAEAGQAVDANALEVAIREYKPKLLAVLHGEGSTGVAQSLSNLAEMAHAQDALLLVDTRWTISALDFSVDEFGIDICIAGSQKAISAYPGLGLITFSPRATQVYDQRQTPVQNWSLDLAHLRQFRSDERPLQTLPAPIVYALTELLQLIYEQGMTYRAQRMVNRRDALVAGFEALGLQIYAHPDHRLSTVTAVRVPSGIDPDAIRQRLLRPYRIDIGGGLGELAGQVWRVGVLGHSAQPTFFVAFLTLLEIILEEAGYPIPERGAAVRALLANLDP